MAETGQYNGNDDLFFVWVVLVVSSLLCRGQYVFKQPPGVGRLLIGGLVVW